MNEARGRKKKEEWDNLFRRKLDKHLGSVEDSDERDDDESGEEKISHFLEEVNELYSARLTVVYRGLYRGQT